MRLTLDLSRIVPSVAVPPMPDQVKSVREAGPVKVDQVYIGSCTNGSYYDLARAARVLRGRRVHPDVNLLVSPSNRQVYQMLLEDGSIGQLVRAGARIMECGCGPCIGLGQAPPTGGEITGGAAAPRTPPCTSRARRPPRPPLSWVI